MTTPTNLIPRDRRPSPLPRPVGPVELPRRWELARPSRTDQGVRSHEEWERFLARPRRTSFHQEACWTTGVAR